MKIRNFRKYLTIGIIALFLFVIILLPNSSVLADSNVTDEHPQNADGRDCKECHLNIKNVWEDSPHAHAFDDVVFYSRWEDMGNPIECLVCHTTSYDQSTGEVFKGGVDCEACHGQPEPDHPQTANKIYADEYY
jgi:hypothetical protein